MSDDRNKTFTAFSVNAVVTCWAAVPVLYLLAYWADAHTIIRSIANLLVWVIAFAVAIATSALVSLSRTKPSASYFRRSTIVPVAYMLSALCCFCLPYAEIDASQVTKFEGVFIELFVERSSCRVRCLIDDNTRSFRLDDAFADRVKNQLAEGENVRVYVYDAYVCQLVANHNNIISLDDYNSERATFGNTLAMCLVAVAVAYWILAPKEWMLRKTRN